MPFNGTGTFSRIYSWITDAANNLNVDATRMDTDTNDIASGLSMCITKDGQQTVTANIPMAGFKFTGLGVGSGSGDSAEYNQVFVSPAFTGTPTAPTAALGTATTQIATTAFVTSTSLTANLPGQTGNAGNVIGTDGSTASWINYLQIPVLWMGVN